MRSKTTLLWLIVLLAGSLASSGGVIAKESKPYAIPRKDVIPDYAKLGTGGGRGGLPEVSLFVRKSQARMFRHGPGGWLDDAGQQPKTMNYPGWNFWHLGVWDALMQLVFEQATDPDGKPAKLGKYHLKFKNSNQFCWNDQPASPRGLILDLSAEVPHTESFQANHYVTYGRGNTLYFNGTARMRLTFDRARHVSVEVLQSTMPPLATANLKAAVESLNAHPVVSFPTGGPQLDKMELIADFNIARKPGTLLLARD